MIGVVASRTQIHTQKNIYIYISNIKVSGDGIYMRFTLNDAQQWPAAAQMKG